MHFVIVGDPGVGKSSILNALVGAVVFDSDISYGSGRTQCLQTHVTNQGDRYSDTAGLGDTRIMEKAELEVTKALRLCPEFKLVFVVAAGTKSAISINKVLDAVEEKIADSLCYATPHIHLYQLIPDLDDEDNKLHEPTPELKSFLEQLPANNTDPLKIEKVRDKHLEKLQEEARRKKEIEAKELEDMKRKEAEAKRQQELERAEQERRHRAKLEAERKEKERLHQEALARERREQERLQQERLERERLERERLRAKQMEAHRREQERIHQEQLAAQQRALEQRHAQALAAARAAAHHGGGGGGDCSIL